MEVVTLDTCTIPHQKRHFKS